MFIATDATPSHWAFSFQGYGLPLSVSGSRSSSMCRAQIALQKLQVVDMVPHRMTSQLSGKVVALHLDNNTSKAYFLIEVVQYLLFFPDWPTRY